MAASSRRSYTDEVQQLTQKLGASHPLSSDGGTLRRYLRVANGDIKVARRMVQRHVEWQWANIPVQVTPELQEELAKGKVYMNGNDRQGRPIIVMRSGRFDPRKRKLDTALMAFVYHVELAMAARPAGVEEIVILYDRRGFKLTKHWDYEYLKNVLKLLAAHYPCRLHSCMMYPVTPVLAGLVRMLSPFADVHLIRALSLIMSKEALLELIPPEHVSTEFGGSCTNDFDRASIRVGGEVASERTAASEVAGIGRQGSAESCSTAGLDAKEREAMSTALRSLAALEGHGSSLTEEALADLQAHILLETSARSQLAGVPYDSPEHLCKGEWSNATKVVCDALRGIDKVNGGVGAEAKASGRPTLDESSVVLKQIERMQGVLSELNRTVSDPAERSKKEGRLADVIDELLSTEAKYVLDLQHTVDHFLTPLQAVLDASKHAKIFSNLKQLCDLHLQLKQEVVIHPSSSAVEKADCVAAGFERVVPFFRMYSTFCAAYSSIADALDMARETKEADVLIGAGQHASRGVALEAFLFRPVQRMCAYPLFFQRALKYAGEGAQKQRFQQLFDSVQEVIGAVNTDVRRQSEQRRAADVLLSEVGGEAAALLTAHRTLALELDVDMQLSSGGDLFSDSKFMSARGYRWYIFSDVLLVCRPNRFFSGYKEKLRLRLSDVKVVAALEGDGTSFELQVQRSRKLLGASTVELLKYRCSAPDAVRRDAVVQKLSALLADALLPSAAGSPPPPLERRGEESGSSTSSRIDSLQSRGVSILGRT